uniref:Apolipoprotein D n=1 Tax=Periophthalmus magnuspinnatus TaxID=409849 RepID=A0A3B3ZDP7_9GOBI
MFAAFALVLGLVSLSRAGAFPVCEKLVGLKDGLAPADVNGTWAFIAASYRDRFAMNTLKQRASITGFFSDNNGTWTYTHANRYGDHCQYGSYGFTFDGSRVSFDASIQYTFTGAFLYTTCPDCLVMKWMINDQLNEMYLLSRRRSLTQSELEEFKAQVQCFQMIPPVTMSPSKPLCPEKPGN